MVEKLVLYYFRSINSAKNLLKSILVYSTVHPFMYNTLRLSYKDDTQHYYIEARVAYFPSIYS